MEKPLEKRKYALGRYFRRNLTDAEARLWVRLKGKPEGLHFRRQHPVGPYIADFYCAAAKLIVEVDGIVHTDEDVARRDECGQPTSKRMDSLSTAFQAPTS